jgi:hypothetical protein
MEGRRENEPGERGRRRLNTRSVIALLCAIAVAGAIGIVLSLGQHRAAPVARPAPTQLGPLPISPTPMPDSPQSGAGFSVAADLATHQVVLFGGVGDYPNTWLWNGSAWTLAHPATSPQGRFGASAAYDPETKTVVLFGGRLEAGTPVHDTWAWNGITWTDLDSGAGGPPPGEGSDMAWDEATSQMVLITSSGVISNPADTWVWAGTHWIHPAGAVLPAGADYSPMSFDPVSKSLLAVGCCVGPPPATGAVSTTWRWTGATWALLPTPGVAPTNGSSLELDPAGKHLLLCACGLSTASAPQFWVWTGTAWAPFSTHPPPVATGMEISDGAELLLFGAPRSASDAQAPPVDVWVLTAKSTWSQLGR